MSFNPVPSLVLVNQFGEKSINALPNGSTQVSVAVTLTAAQVIALNATPQVLVPAIAGKSIQVVSIALSYVRGSASFTIGSSKFLKAQYHTGPIAIGQLAETGFIDQATSQAAVIYGPGAGGKAVSGQAVELTSDDSTIGAGTGSTLVCQVYYNIIG